MTTSSTKIGIQNLLIGGALLCFLLLAAFSYYPGLGSDFFLDDYQNLKRLSWLDDPLTWQGLWTFAVTGEAGDLGRPLAYASFALQHHAWPSDPASFKSVNLALHLLNGCLVFWLSKRVGNHLHLANPALTALALSAAWMMHPLNVSTVLYTVQRMTELSAAFTLGGLLLYVHGRTLLDKKPAKGYAWMTLGVVLGTGLALTGKETGVLTPLYVLIIEATLLRGMAKPSPRFAAWQAFFLWLPNIVIIGYLGLRFNSWIMPGYEARNFNLSERLLTESRVVFSYLSSILFPGPRSLGLFHDDFQISRNLFAPIQTPFSVAGIILGGLAALIWRKRFRYISFAILWFLGGHLLESTAIPLEIYFEHRNYLPMLGPLALISGICAETFSNPRWRSATVIFTVSWLAGLALLTLQEARLWGNPVIQAHVWAMERPESLRAQELQGSVLARSGQYQAAAQHFARLAAKPAYGAAYVAWIQAGCYDASIELPKAEAVVPALQRIPFSNWPSGAMEQIITLREEGGCARASSELLSPLFKALSNNPRFALHQMPLLTLHARLLHAEGRNQEALSLLGQAFALSRGVDLALLHVKWLSEARDFDHATAWLAKAKQANMANMAARRYFHEKEINDWEILLRQMQRPGTGFRGSQPGY